MSPRRKGEPKKRGRPVLGPLRLLKVTIRVTADQRTWLKGQVGYNNIIRQMIWLKMTDQRPPDQK